MKELFTAPLEIQGLLFILEIEDSLRALHSIKNC